MTEFKKNLKWALIFLLIIIMCLSVMIFYNPSLTDSKTAQIIQDGKIIRTVDLQKVSEPYEFEIYSDSGGQNTVRVEKGRIGIIHANCPDKICVKRGFIDSDILPIVCLPNRLSVVVSDNNDVLDAISGGDTM